MAACFTSLYRAFCPNLQQDPINEEDAAEQYLTLPVSCGEGAWDEGKSSNQPVAKTAGMPDEMTRLLARDVTEKLYGMPEGVNQGDFENLSESDCEDVSISIRFDFKTSSAESRCTPKPATCVRLALVTLGVTSFGMGLFGAFAPSGDHRGAGQMTLTQGLSLVGMAIGVCLIGATANAAEYAPSGSSSFC